MKVSLLVVAGLAAAGVFADKVVLKSGSFLTGTAGAVAGDSLEFTSDDLGAVNNNSFVSSFCSLETVS